MSHFVPLFSEPAPSDGPAPGFAALVTPPAAAPAPTPTSPATSTTGSPAITSAPTDDCTEPPQVTLIRDNDRITRIVVQCACGRQLELDCVY